MRRLPPKTRGPIRAAANDVSPARAGSRNGSQATTEEKVDDPRSAALKLLRFPAVRERTGLSRSTIWRLERQGAFPRHHRISTNAVAWIEDDIATWIRSKVTGVAV